MASTHNWKRTITGRASVLYSNAKSRCREKNIELHLTQEWIREHLKRGTCEITGLPFSLEPPDEHATRRPDAPSLDRIDKDKHYTEDNTRVILWAVNCALSEYGTEGMLPILKAMVIGIENAKKNTTTSIPTGTNNQSTIGAEFRTVFASWPRQNYDHTYNHSRTVHWQNANHSTQASSGDGVGRGGEEVETPFTLTSIQIDGKPKPEISWIKLGGGHIPD
jgi:hypothetical protein